MYRNPIGRPERVRGRFLHNGIVLNQRDPKYDLPEFHGERRAYLIAATPRSGSNLLGRLLMRDGRYGAPLEYLHDRAPMQWTELASLSTPEYLDRIATYRTSPTGWFGVKALWKQYGEHMRTGMTLDYFDQIIRISRRDLVGQAISLTMARLSHSYYDIADERNTASATPQYDYRQICLSLAYLTNGNTKWDALIEQSGRKVVHVVYEDLQTNPTDVLTGIHSAFGHELHADERTDIELPRLQRTELNEKWRQRFITDSKRYVLPLPLKQRLKVLLRGHL